MRHRWTFSILMAGALLVGTACSSDREPLAPAPTPDFSLSSSPSVDVQIHRLIPQLFPGPLMRAAVFIAHEYIEWLLKKGKTALAQQKTLDLVAFTLQRYANHHLIGDQSAATQARLRSFVDLSFQFVGLGSAPIPPDALGPDGAVAMVGPAGGQVVTGTEFAGVTFPPNALSQTVVVALSRNPNQSNPLPTTLAQIPLFYDFKTFPEVPVFGEPVVVGVCVLDALIPAGHAESLRLAHPLHSDPSTIEILPLVAAPFLDCTGAGLEFGTRKSPMTNLADAGRSIAKDLFWVMMGAPRDLQASASRRMMMPGGLGGRTTSFSTFGAVDFTGTLVPYQSAGYRYLQLGPGEDPPEGFASVTFTDTEWSTGAAAFGTGSCPLSSTIHTPWPAASPVEVTNPEQFTEILLRKTFDVPAGVGDVTVGVAIDNDVQVFVNGVNITGSGGATDGTGFLRHEDCPTLDSFTLTVPDEVLHSGTNLVVVRARDRGVQSFVDIRVSGVLQEE